MNDINISSLADKLGLDQEKKDLLFKSLQQDRVITEWAILRLYDLEDISVTRGRELLVISVAAFQDLYQTYPKEFKNV